MDWDDAGEAPACAGEGGVRLEARIRRLSLLWWAATCVFSCLLNFTMEAPRAWLSDVANFAAGSGVAAAWSWLVAGWLCRRRRYRRKVFGAGLGLAVLGGLVSGAAAAFAGSLMVVALKLQQLLAHLIGYDLEHYTALFLAWCFICEMLFSSEQTARIEEGVVRLRVLVLKAEEAALRDRFQPGSLNGALVRIGAALAQRRREEAERIVMTLAESLRTALSSQGADASLGGLRPGEAAGPRETGLVEGGVPGFGSRLSVDYPLISFAFWGVALCVMTISVAPTYIHSVFTVKLFILIYLVAFCITGFFGSLACCAFWKLLGAVAGVIEKCLAVVIIGLGAAFASAWIPAQVAAVYWKLSGLKWQIILTAMGYYAPLYVVWHCVYFYVEAVRRETAQRAVLAQVAEAAAAARNSMLRYQVRPHFLFNALNALYVLIADECWARAGAMTEALSAYIERSFAEDERELVPIGEQAEALHTYLSIERVRFGDRLRVHVDIPDGLARACAPSLILQPLIENAMKYAVAATAEPVDVEIAAVRAGETLLLRVRDSGSDAEAPAAPGLGIGLRNVAARLAGHYGQSGGLQCKRLTPKGFVAEIRLPLEFECTHFAA